MKRGQLVSRHSYKPVERNEYLELGNIRIGVDGLAEIDGPRKLLFIPKAEVLGLELIYASGAERPLVTAAVGVALLVLALFPFVFLFLVISRGGHMHTSLFWFSAFGVLGVWLLWFALRPRHVLLVHTSGGPRKLVFHRQAVREDVVRFITEAAPRFKYSALARSF